MVSRIFFGVPVYTMDENRTVQQAVVSINGRIDFVGNMNDALKLYPEAEKIKFAKGCIFPGLIDAHIHMRRFSLLFKDLDLSQVVNKVELLTLLTEQLTKKEKGEWVVAGGCRPALLEELTAGDIDPVSSTSPVVIYSSDLNFVLANSHALAAAGIDENRKDPLRGKIETDLNNRPTGILRDRAIEFVRKQIPEESPKKVVYALEKGIGKLITLGITTFCDCSQDALQLTLKSLFRLQKKRNLGVKKVLLFGDLEAQNLERFGIPSLFGDNYIKLGGLKIILDGTLATLTGYMSEPYRSSESHGMLLMEESELLALLKRVYSNHIWASVQAVGDRANSIALNCFEKLRVEKGHPELIKRIDFAHTLQDDDIERAASLEVMAIANPIRIPFGREQALRALGSNARLLYRYGSLLKSGVVLGMGSDAPYASVDPFHAIYCAVERKDYNDGPEVRFYPKERISMSDAIYAYTMGNARALGMGDEIGSLEAGKSADLIHVSKDILQGPSESLRDTEVLHTVIDGNVVWERKG
jgi:predicted amidohydrolase YtcJ